MKKIIEAEGVTEYRPGPHLARLEARFDASGAVVLLLDVSSSMHSDMESAIRGALGFVDEASEGGYQVGAALWSTEVEASERPSKDIAQVKELLRGARAWGGTNATPALLWAGSELLALDVKDRVIAIFGDGDLGDEERAKAIGSGLAAEGVRIITLGLGSASAQALSVVATEAEHVGEATHSTLSEDIRGLARGLTMRKNR